MTDRSYRIWQYKAVLTNLSTEAGNLSFRFTPSNDNRIIFEYGAIGKDDYASNRTSNVLVRDSITNEISRLAAAGTVDNQRLPLFFTPDDSAAPTADEPPIKLQDWELVGTDHLFVRMSSLAQAETLTLIVRARVWGPDAPVVDTSDSIDHSTTTAYNLLL